MAILYLILGILIGAFCTTVYLKKITKDQIRLEKQYDAYKGFIRTLLDTMDQLDSHNEIFTEIDKELYNNELKKLNRSVLENWHLFPNTISKNVEMLTSTQKPKEIFLDVYIYTISTARKELGMKYTFEQEK